MVPPPAPAASPCPSVVVVLRKVSMTSPVHALCPECGEPAVPRPPTSWTPAWGPRPPYSHNDGEPLCPVIGTHGYQPADPVHPDGTPIDVDEPAPGERG